MEERLLVMEMERTTSTVQANTGAGFSIVTYTGDGANGTVGHGYI